MVALDIEPTPKDEGKEEEDDMRVSCCFLTSLMFALGFGDMNFGFALVSTNSCWDSIVAQIGQDWSQTEANTKLSVLNALAITGLAVGSFAGGLVI